MARYSLRIKSSATKEINNVGQKKDRQRIVADIQSLADSPRPRGCEKLAGVLGGYRIRVGQYRIVYSVDDRELVVVIVRVGHRKEVYR